MQGSSTRQVAAAALKRAGWGRLVLPSTPVHCAQRTSSASWAAIPSRHPPPRCVLWGHMNYGTERIIGTLHQGACCQAI